MDGLRRLQVASAALLAVAVAGMLANDVLRSPEVPFLPQDGTPWIVAQTPIQTHGMVIERAHPPLSFFELRFRAAEPHRPVTLRVRALRDASLVLNGKELPPGGRAGDRWKEAAVVDVTSDVVAGDNVLFARVTNPDGNPALQIRIDGLVGTDGRDLPLQTDEAWTAAWEGDPAAHAALADDVLRHPESADLPAPPAALAANALPVALLGGVGAALFLLLRRRPGAARWAPATALAALALFWSVFFAKVIVRPAEIGFDAAAHLAYVRWIFEHHALPLASDGAVMYHPPLFHAVAALLLCVTGPDGPLARAALVAVPMLSGFGLALVGRGLARRLVPGAPWVEAGALVAAGLLPMNLTLAACVSNEAPHALLAALAVFATVCALVRERATLRDDLGLGLLLGAAVLTKYSSLVLLPILVGALATKRLVAERTSLARSVSRGALSLAIAAALAGWVYLRNQQHFGNALVWNLNVDPAQTWWQLPGFHTAAYFLGFGDALTRPWFSSFHSLWDGLYTTLWGDGLLSGATSPAGAGARWRYDWMAAAFLLALPATALLGVGWARLAFRALRGGDLGRRLADSLLVLLPVLFLVSLVGALLRYPFWSGPKSFYGLLLTPELGLLGVLGFAALDDLLARRAPLALRALPWGWAAAFLGAIAWAFAG